MNTHKIILENASTEATTSDRILQTAFAAWRQWNFVEVVDQFNDQFTFIDHALGLEFKHKERLTEFLGKIGERYPDSERKITSISTGRPPAFVESTLPPLP